MKKKIIIITGPWIVADQALVFPAAGAAVIFSIGFFYNSFNSFI